MSEEKRECPRCGAMRTSAVTGEDNVPTFEGFACGTTIYDTGLVHQSTYCLHYEIAELDACRGAVAQARIAGLKSELHRESLRRVNATHQLTQAKARIAELEEENTQLKQRPLFINDYE